MIDCKRFYEHLCKIVETYIRRLNPEIALEIGYGRGFMLYSLSKKFANVHFVGMDPEGSYLKNQNLEILRSKFEDVKLNFKADIIYSFNVIHLVNDLSRFIAKMREVISDKGLCIVGWNTQGYTKDGKWFMENKSRHREKEIIKKLKKHFNIEDKKEYTYLDGGINNVPLHYHKFLLLTLKPNKKFLFLT